VQGPELNPSTTKKKKKTNPQKTKITSVGKDAEKRTLIHYQRECKLVQPLWKIVWIFLKKLQYNYHVAQKSH
jgi:hypothetical protein